MVLSAARKGKHDKKDRLTGPLKNLLHITRNGALMRAAGKEASDGTQTR
jgi:hypothetical protein